MELKKCPYCGKTVLAISKVCKHCKKSFEQNQKNVEETTVRDDKTIENESYAEIPNLNNQLNSDLPTKNKPIGLIVGIVTVLLLIIILVTNSTPKPIEEAPIALDTVAFDTIPTISQTEEQIEEKFLITNNSAGYFTLDGSWQSYARDDYNYQYVQGYGNCLDAACDGGFDLGDNIVNSEYGPKIENPKLTIGATLFEASEINNLEIDSVKYSENPNVFFVSSDNSYGWYWKDKISYLVLLSDAFKTKEGIGVGTNLEKVKETYDNLSINVGWGWVEEDVDAVYFKLDSYPNIDFILDADDAIGGYDFLSTHKGQTISVSDFKENTKIKRIIISKN